MVAAHVEKYLEEGFAIVRGVFSKDEMNAIRAEVDAIYDEGLKHHASYRHKNLYFEILPEEGKRPRCVLQAHWFAWINGRLEELRRDLRYFEILSPLLGSDIKQVANQIHWKPPAAGLTGFRFHQDMRFREKPEAYREIMTSYVTTGLAIDAQTAENGALRIVPGSHRKGYLGLSDDGPLMKGETPDEELLRAGLDPKSIVQLEMEPGDVALWSLLTVHGSAPNRSARERRFNINSYVRAANSERGEWAFRGGHSTPLGAEPQICKYEQLYEKPGPFYVDDKWYR